VDVISLSPKLKSKISQLNAHWQKVRDNLVVEDGEEVASVEAIVVQGNCLEHATSISQIANVLDQGFDIEALELSQAVVIAESKIILEKVLEGCNFPVQYELDKVWD